MSRQTPAAGAAGADTRAPIGLIAGGGGLPLLALEAAEALGWPVVVVRLAVPAVPGGTGGGEDDDPQTRRLEARAHRRGYPFYRFPLSRWEAMVQTLRRHGVQEVYAAGKLNRLAAMGQLDHAAAAESEARQVLDGARFLGDEALSGRFAAALERHGMRLGEQPQLLGRYLAPAGVLTRRAPDVRERSDLQVGWRLARGIAALDIGQTVVVYHGTVLAVEAAVEGTDATIRRGARLAGHGAVVVKVSRPHQDLRVDMPVIGSQTVRAMARHRASVLGIEAGRCLILGREAVVRAADKAGIAIVAE